MLTPPNTPLRNPVMSQYVSDVESAATYGVDPFETERIIGEMPELQRLESPVVLDIGSGVGSSFVAWLKRARSVQSYVHLDLDLRCFTFGRKALEMPQGQQFYEWDDDLRVVADALSLPLATGSVDLIHEDYMRADNPRLRPVTLWNRLDSEILRVLRQGGLYVSTHSRIPERCELLAREWPLHLSKKR